MTSKVQSPKSKERPILFSGEMVKAILAGTKTQTRRGMSEQPSEGWFPSNYGEVHKMRAGQFAMKRGAPITIGWGPSNQDGSEAYACPYGQVGDRIWVKETFYQLGHWVSVPNVKTKTGRMKWKFVPQSDDIEFEPPPSFRKGRHHKDPLTVAWHKRLARFMPRKYSRINLEITGVRVERLQNISEADAEAEGVDFIRHHPDADETLTARKLYEFLWDSINGEGSWNKNPWVWVIEFKHVDPKEIMSGDEVTHNAG